MGVGGWCVVGLLNAMCAVPLAHAHAQPAAAAAHEALYAHKLSHVHTHTHTHAQMHPCIHTLAHAGSAARSHRPSTVPVGRSRPLISAGGMSGSLLSPGALHQVCRSLPGSITTHAQRTHWHAHTTLIHTLCDTHTHTDIHTHAHTHHAAIAQPRQRPAPALLDNGCASDKKAGDVSWP